MCIFVRVRCECMAHIAHYALIIDGPNHMYMPICNAQRLTGTHTHRTIKHARTWGIWVIGERARNIR